MAADPQPKALPASHHLAARLRLAGYVVLVIGLATAAFVCWIGPGSSSKSEDNSLVDGYYKSQSSQMQQLWGNLGPVMLNLREDLRNPGIQAAIIAAASILIALVCFQLARRFDRSSPTGNDRHLAP